MVLRDWDSLPDFMKCEEVKEYYDILKKRKIELLLKRVFDICFSSIMLILFILPMIIISILIKLDSLGPVFYCQERITTYGKKFKIHKFRTMIKDADKIGTTITVDSDLRITNIGKILRRFRIDEFPQLLDVLSGNMSFVGTRPEITKYVKQYSREMYATLLLPAGITSEASIHYKDEGKLLNNSEDADKTYVECVLPGKMKYNLNSIRKFGLIREFGIMFRTIFAVLGRECR